jgi:hypothetical protein
VLAVDESGKLKHTLSLLIAPRRMGKSTIFALLIIWLFVSKSNWTAQLLGTSSDHARRTQYNLIKRIILNTAALRKMIGERNIIQGEISYPARGNVIQMSGVNASTSFGDRLSLLWVSDLHAATDLEPFMAYQSSLLDSQDSLVLIDSNTSPDGPVPALEQQAKDDPSIYCSHISFLDLDHYMAEAPSWLSRDRAKRLEKILMPAQFARDVLGQTTDNVNALFPSAIIELCKSDYAFPVTDLKALTSGRAYRCGGGLDRARSLFQSSTSDASVWTTVAKVASPAHGEAEYFVLSQEIFPINTSRLIKSKILKDHEKYKLDACTIEFFETVDLSSWLSDVRIPHELLNPTGTNQNAAFPELYRIAREGRLHFPRGLDVLAREMSNFTYTQKTGGGYVFGHSSTKFHDDCVYSLCWAVHSLRDAVMQAYCLGSFACKNRTPQRNFCFLMDGDLILHCSASCNAFQQVEGMFRSYKAALLESELTIQEFYAAKVKFSGAKIYQAA